MRYPDLLVAFGVDPEAYLRSNVYVVSEQGKAPDFVLEVASRSTGRVDVTEKRVDYARLGSGEYWRFDEMGEYHGANLAGDRLVEGRYEPILIETMSDGVLQGYSPVLNLYLRWEHGVLAFHDPTRGVPSPALKTSCRRERLPKPAPRQNGRVAPRPKPVFGSWKSGSEAGETKPPAGPMIEKK